MAEHNNTRGLVSRRGLLKGTAVAAGVSALSFSQQFGITKVSAQLQDHQDSIELIANLAATAETLAATSYFGTLNLRSFSLSAASVAYMQYALSAELYHLEILQSLGGRSLAGEFYIPETFLTSLATNTATFVAAETAFTGAYLAATRRMAELNQPRLAATTAQHAATEAEHLALSRQVGGLFPNPNGLPAPIYYNVSDAVPTLTPFLQGGKGFIGPVKFPGIDAIKSYLGNKMAVRVPTFTQVF